MKNPRLFLLGNIFYLLILSCMQQKGSEKIASAIDVLVDFEKLKMRVPQKILNATQGIIIIPHFIIAGDIPAGEAGNGIALIKKRDGFWSNPVFLTFRGRITGYEQEKQSVSVLLLVMKRETLLRIDDGSFNPESNHSILTGPVRSSFSTRNNDIVGAVIYLYTISDGLFTTSSATDIFISLDKDATKEFYGKEATVATIFQTARWDTSKELTELKKRLKNQFSQPEFEPSHIITFPNSNLF